MQLDVKVEHIQFSHQNTQQMQQTTDVDVLIGAKICPANRGHIGIIVMS